MKNSIIFIGLLLIATSQSHAIEYGLQKNEFGFDGGKIKSASGNDFKTILDEANVFGVHYTRFITPRFGIGGQVDFLSGNRSDYAYLSSYDNTFNIYTNSTARADTKIEDLSFMATGRLNIWTRGMVVPYLSAGLGLNRFSIKSSAFADTYISYPDPLNPGMRLSNYSSASASENKSSVNLCGMLGLGADIMISEVFRIGFEGRYNYYKQSAISGAGDLEMFMSKGKISWYF